MTPSPTKTNPAPAQAARQPQMIDVVLQSLDDAKAEDTIAIDITGKSALSDHMVVTSGRSHRHVGAVADQLARALREAGFDKPRVEGLPHCDWVLVDGGDVIVHIFRPEVREFYNIEKMWAADFAADAH
ncbi:ribosome silencing factor [Arsenicitalea aurantiaca]|uniref:Ribosomal silencing factor RsfS n=1 Tax=Arsenicitalea aurantiaca TaxID=1783274 RepID=A0A433X7I6_9HYPH|nr:ribosome silencing factor [Arsenicitalea aurantiaca]RUT30010.1 ribosome silencing factor [Arsenicitalea aurantiaca]